MRTNRKCPGCRATPRRVRAEEREDGVHLFYKCLNPACPLYRQEVGEEVLQAEGGHVTKETIRNS